jgi:branched-chain amino acid transport system permease protein
MRLHRRTALMLPLLAVLLSGCAVDRARIDECRRAVAAVLGVSPEDARWDRAPDDGDWIVLSLGGEAGATHGGACRFVPQTALDRSPMLRALQIDGVGLAPIRLQLLGLAIGVPIEPPAAQEAPPSIPAGRDLPFLVQELLDGLVLGAVLGLTALGYSIVYGVARTVFFAYGPLVAAGACLAIVLTVLARNAGAAIGGVGALLLVGMATSGLIALWGWAGERLVYRPLREVPGSVPLVAGIGLAGFLENGLRLAQGRGEKWLDPLFTGRHILFEQAGFVVMIGDTQLAVLGLTAVLGVGGAALLRHSAAGRAYRACTDDRFMAALLGVDVDRVAGGGFALGAGLAALAGVIYAVQYGEADAQMGFLIGFKALAAAVLGGLGSLRGAVLGGFAIGLVEALWTAYLGSAYRDVAIFGLLCLALIYRPQGLFGTARD